MSYLKELEEIALEYSEENWDGYDADPITLKSVENAKKLLAAIPDTCQNACPAPTPNGNISFEWHDGKNIVSLEISGTNLIYASAGEQSFCGQENFTGKIPDRVLMVIQKLWPNA